MKTLLRAGFALSLLVQLACGGGSHSTPPATPIPAPNATITATNSVPQASTGQTASVPAQAGATYAWTITGGTITAGATTNAVTFTAGTGTSLVLSVTVTNSAAVAANAFKLVNIDPTPILKATGLAYVDPANTGWRLVKNTTLTTSNHLVLDLMAPASTTGLGSGFQLRSDATKITWTKVASTDADFVQNVAFALGAGPQLIKGNVRSDDVLVGVFQPGTASPVNYSGALLRVALDYQTAANLDQGTVLPLSVVKAQHAAADGAASAITIAVGSLKAQ